MGVSIHDGPGEADATDVALQCTVSSVEEKVASSQGSPFFRPAFHMKKLMQLVGGGDDFPKSRHYLNGVSYGSALTTAVAPGTLKVRNMQVICQNCF